jgi:hypothetical protein
MEWTDEAIVLALRPHGESSGILEALHSNKKLTEHCIEINRIEGIVDGIVRDAVRELFDNEKDPIKLIKLKEIYELLEQTTDDCEDVADALQNVVVKNS